MSGRGTIKSRSPGSFRIRYSLGRDPLTGKRKFGSKTVRGTKEAAERELTRLLRTVDTGEHVAPSRIKVGDWLEFWVNATKAEVSPKTHERYAEIVRCYLKPALGSIALQRLAPADIQRAYNNFDRNPSPRTRRHIHRILKSVLTRAVELQALPRNPADALNKRMPRVERKPINALTVEQSTRLLKAIRHTTTYWPTLIALATGMRRGEILALRWKNLDLGRGIVRVVESLEQTKAGLRFKSTKADKPRAVPLPKFAIVELRNWKRQQAENLLRLGVRQSPDGLVCAREDGEPKQPSSLTHEFAYLIGRVAVPRVRFHDLRHSHATQLLAAGVHPKIVQERLGHSTITVTMDLYSHVSETMQSDATARLDNAYGESW